MKAEAIIVLILALAAVITGSAPQFFVKFENTTVEEGETVELYCFATGEQPMTYMWYNQSDYIPEIPDSSVSVSSSSNGSWLRIREVKSFHEGMYTCNANNSHGLDSKLYHLDVSARRGNNDTDNDTRSFKAVIVSANSVLLQIPASGIFHVIYWELGVVGNRTDLEFPPNPDNLYSFENLNPGRTYVFRYRNVSSEGIVGKWSPILQVTLLPDVQEIIVRRHEKGSLEIEWFSKVDDIINGTIDKYEITYYSVSKQGDNEWVPRDCATTNTIQIPSCRGASYIIYGLRQWTYYVIELRAHTVSGYGKPGKLKVYVKSV